MESEPQETDAVGYLIEREERLASARVCVLVDRQHATSKESLRWDVVPVAVRGAILHAKVAVLCWANHVRLIVGSGNLTEPAYRKNVEVFGSIDVSRVEGGLVNVVLSCVDFLEQVLGYALGAEDEGPRKRAREMLAAVRTHVGQWPQHDGRGRVVPVFAGVDRSLLEQLAEIWPSSSPPRYARVLSPFYDEPGSGTDVVAGLVQTMAKRRPRSIRFHAPATRLPDGSLQVEMPRETVAEAQVQADVEVYEVRAEQDEEIRPLHAKMLVLGNDEWELVLIGSSNFTRAGFGLRTPTGQPGNLEANLAYIARKDEAEFRRLEQVWPEVGDEPVDLTSDKIVWLPTTESEGEQAAAAVLPAAFEEALFDASGSRRLILRLGADLPDWWQIRDAEGRPILGSMDWDERIRWLPGRMLNCSCLPRLSTWFSWCRASDGRLIRAPVTVRRFPDAALEPVAFGVRVGNLPSGLNRNNGSCPVLVGSASHLYRGPLRD